MRTTAAAIAAAACLALGATACGPSGTDTGGAKPKASKSSSKPGKSEDDVCGPNSDLSKQDWIDLCEKGQGLGAEADAKPKPLGKPQTTAGFGGEGQLQITPTSIVYVDEATHMRSENGVFAVIVTQVKNVGGVAAAEARLGDGGGWKWVTPDGTAIDFSNTDAATNAGTETFTGGGYVQPDTKAWNTQAFDLTEQQAKSGTLMYVDGAGVAYKWTAPAKDFGPQAAQLKKELAE